MASIASLEEEKAGALEQLEIILTQLRDDPDNAELLILQEELNQMIALLDESLAELKPKQAPPAQKHRGGAPPPSTDNEPDDQSASHAPAPPPEEESSVPVSYNVNDTVMAKWVSGDKSFYPARITSITGSSTAPIYIVKFKNYDEVDTVRAKDIRPMSNKRKADSVTAVTPTITPPPPPPTATPGVISTAASLLYPEAQAAKEAEAEQEDGARPPKAKKLKAKKELEAGKNKWQEFSNKKFSKSSKKDSMFRTPEGIHGRVGFTGSGQAMRKDVTRTRHVYQQNEELD